MKPTNGAQTVLEQQETARAELRDALARAVAVGVDWREIIRMVAEKWPLPPEAPTNGVGYPG